MSTVKNNMMPPNLVSNLEQALLKRKDGNDDESNNEPDTSKDEVGNSENGEDSTKPRVLVTNADGVDSPGLLYLVEALVKEGLYNLYVCAPQSDKSVVGYGVTFGETIGVSSVEMKGATAYEVSGTPVDCVSLALSGALFAWSKPALVVSGINKGSNCGLNMYYSGVVAGAREALISGVPSLSLSLNWKKDESKESDFKDAVALSIPIINAAVRDVENGSFPAKCGLSIQIPKSPSTNKGFKVTKQSSWRPKLCWQAVSAKKPGGYMSNQPGFGLQLAQLGRDASAKGAARRSTTQNQNEEIESVGVRKSKSERAVKKHFRLEFVEVEHGEADEEFDIKALEDGFVAVTPICITTNMDSDTQTAASDWITATCKADQ